MTRKWDIVPVADYIPFDNSSNGFVADNVQDAIEEASEDNFSYFTIAVSVTITIPIYQQMTVFGPIIIDGTLIITGQLILET